MHPPDCPQSWEYDDNPDALPVLTARSHAFLVTLKTLPASVQPLLQDSRPAHAMLYENLTPEACPYFAGRFRGDKPRCIRWVNVTVGGDPLVGADSKVVDERMRLLTEKIQQFVKVLDVEIAKAGDALKISDLLGAVVPFAAYALEAFLTIHPYVNGNGHLGRLLVWVLCARYRIFPKSWPLEESPPYGFELASHRRGNIEPLQVLILKSIIE